VAALGVTVFACDSSEQGCVDAREAGLVTQRLDITWQTYDVFGGWCAHVGAQAVVADRAVLARLIGHRAYPPRPASFSTMWARWWTESVQSAGVRYLWTEGADGLNGLSLATVADECSVLDRVGWRTSEVDTPAAYLVAAG
jgi:hypothetical protein